MKHTLAILTVAFLCLAHGGNVGAAAKTIRLLTIGNSFADNALTFLPQIVEAAGHKLIVGRANLGGCSLERHWKHAAQHEAAPKGTSGSPYRSGKFSLSDMLTKDRWDFITLQQVSYKSHDLSTYHPYVEHLHRYVVERAPQAKILAHQIWAYRVDDPRFVPKNAGIEPHTQKAMYEQVRAAYRTIAKELGIGILPSGDAMFIADTDSRWGYAPDQKFDFSNAKHPHVPDQTHSLHTGWFWRTGKDGKRTLKMDGHHASTAGKFLLGCVWFEKFYGESVVDSSFRPKGLNADYANFLRQAAHKSMTALNSPQHP
jgi:hypothetical protein